jgi:hypothetical protein
VLFAYCISVPAALLLSGGRLWPLLAMAAVAYVLSAWFIVVPSYIYLDRIANYLIFFLLGGLAQRRPETSLLIGQGFVPLLCCFVIGLCFLATRIFDDAAFVICNFLGIPALHGITWRMSQNRLLLWFGKYALVVYLLNSLFIGLGKGVLLKFVAWDGVNFLLFAPILGALGLFGPIVMKQPLLSELPAVDRMTD